MCFSLVGSDSGHKLGVDDFAAGWNVAATNKKDCGSASGNACANTLGKAAEVVGESVGPNFPVRPSYEVAVFQEVTGHLVDDRVGRSQGVIGDK